ncbi:MAG: glutamate racemase [Spongiibacteraceae bacterium]
MSERASAPIGVFDSGVGGLSVLKHMRALLPAENFLYVADSGYAPYGERSPEFICERSLNIANFLLEKNIKALVVACNTATAAAVQMLRERLSIPVIAMEPGIKPAVELTRSKVVGVLATAGTLESARFFSLVNRYAGDVEIVTQPCAGLVERIEANDLSSSETLDLLRGYLDPLLNRGADVIVLGCTHYPFLREQIKNIIGHEIAIIDTGPAVAKELKRRLESTQLLCTDDRLGGEIFWTSGDLSQSQVIHAQLWGRAAQTLALL